MTETQTNQTLAGSSIVLATLATAGAVYLAADFLVPFTFGLVLAALLWPVVQRLNTWRIPTPAGAAITVLGTVAILAAVMVAFAPPIRKFSSEIPKTIAAARPKLTALSTELRRLTGGQGSTGAKPPAKPAVKKSSADSNKISTPDSAASRRDTAALNVTDTSRNAAARDTARTAPLDTTRNATHDTTRKALTNRDSTSSATRDPSKNTSRISSAPQSQSQSQSQSGTGLPDSAPVTIAHALGIATGLLGDLVEVMLLALFILAAGNSWGEKLALAVTNAARRNSVKETVNKMRAVVVRYLVATTMINIGQASVVALTLHFLGYPSALLWGVLTFLLEFIPYFGGMVMIGLVFVAGIAAGKDVGAAVGGPAAYLVITSLQNNLVSPIAYGKGMRLNPTAILAALMLWYLVWGVAGAFLAVPILAAFRVLCDELPPLKGVGAFISD